MLYIIHNTFTKAIISLDTTFYAVNGVPENSLVEGFMATWALIFVIVGLVILTLLGFLIKGLIKNESDVSLNSGLSILGVLGVTALIFRLEKRRFSKYILKNRKPRK